MEVGFEGGSPKRETMFCGTHKSTFVADAEHEDFPTVEGCAPLRFFLTGDFIVQLFRCKLAEAFGFMGRSSTDINLDVKRKVVAEEAGERADGESTGSELAT